MKLDKSSSVLTLELPIYWQQTQKKTVLVGMNAYRNWHYFTSNKFKQEFSELVHNQTKDCKKGLIEGTYRLAIGIYYKNPSCDGSNIAALIEKVVLDELQAQNIVAQDSVKYHLGTHWSVLGQDKDNPRAIIHLMEIP